jgi:hypothetical protein
VTIDKISKQQKLCDLQSHTTTNILTQFVYTFKAKPSVLSHQGGVLLVFAINTFSAAVSNLEIDGCMRHSNVFSAESKVS